MNLFTSTLARIYAGMKATFHTDKQLADWVVSLENIEPAKQAIWAKSYLELINRIGHRWLTKQLLSFDDTEAYALLNSACAETIKNYQSKNPVEIDIAKFSYTLTNRLMNTDVRKENATFKNVDPYTFQRLLQYHFNQHQYDIWTGDEYVSSFREVVIAALESRSSKKNGSVSRTTKSGYNAVKIIDVWEHIISEVEDEFGEAAARPTSLKVVEALAARLDLTENEVNAAIKLIKRSIEKRPNKNK
ncbi:hypothetical protein KUL42_34400 [Alteromonas sp. KUL42]|uniref:hypothetical protein n=1 Tax=Alteromonas sp. KUL42 TaxID=2480797 RepID=UPI0010361317|nr:hypothetical protein [Alteromonas sp. KUL42]TAP32517.1 hypothetical protein EYR97_16985 [Alteromonas sp. KUL42]GEA08679.1 hypothetical protein KUL42_34400 [Alteromonas sp. KUL42]